MASRTQIVCLHEGKKGRSIDPVFINKLLNTLKPNWIRPWAGRNLVRPEGCGGRGQLIQRVPEELKICLSAGGNITLMVWADVDDDVDSPDDLKEKFWVEAQVRGVARSDFDTIVFVFAKDRLENWIEYLNTGTTNEFEEGPRIRHGREVSDAAKKLAECCLRGAPLLNAPPSLEWSCKNWRTLRQRMG